MKKNNLAKRIFSVFLVALLAIAMPLAVSAQEVNVPEEMIFPIAEDKVGLDDSSIQPRGFTRTYTRYLTSSPVLIVSDGNWFGEDAVLVQFTDSKGPTQISVYVVDGEGNTIGPKTISLSRSTGFLLKTVSGSFEVYARKAAGYDGDVTMKVQLTNTYG